MNRLARRLRHRLAGIRAPRFSIATFVKAVIGLIVAVALSVSAAGSTYAYLNSQVVVPLNGAATTQAISAGTASFTLTGTAATLTNFYPGVSGASGYTITNTGNVPLALRVEGLSVSGTYASTLSYRAVIVANAGLCSTSVTGGWTGSNGSAAGTLGNTLAVGQTSYLCIVSTLGNPANGTQGGSSTATITIGGQQL